MDTHTAFALSFDRALTRQFIASVQGSSRIVLNHCSVTLLRMPEGTLLLLHWLPTDRSVTLLFSRLVAIARQTHQCWGPSFIVCGWRVGAQLNLDQFSTTTVMRLYGR